MAQPDITQRVRDLKNALSSIEGELKGGDTPPQGLEEFKAVVDSVRLSVWAILSGAKADNFQTFIGGFRLRRGSDICRQILGDIESGTLHAEHPEFGDFKETVEELASALARAMDS
jgi:hypothetical protein